MNGDDEEEEEEDVCTVAIRMRLMMRMHAW